MEITFNELISAIDGSIVVDNENKEFDKVCIDTRKIEKKNLYFALKGENFNGNDFVEKAFDNGATISIVDEVNFNKEDVEGKGLVIKVDNCHKALLSLANFYRKKLNIKVVGVTGSTGKTSTKDLIAAVLSDKYKVFKTKGNFNNEIGLPLMIFELSKDYDVAVLEMGMSDLGEIHVLAETALPDIAVITNIGMSHMETLKTQENILKAKMEIVDFFKSNNILILNGEDIRLKKFTSDSFKVKKIGYNHEYDVYASNIILREDLTEFTAHGRECDFTFKIPMAGKHNVLNMMLAIEVAKNLDVSLESMNRGLVNLEATSMRLQVIKTCDITIINDCYNASPDSMKSSLDVLNTYKDGRKVAILGDMFELGDKSNEVHTEVGEYASSRAELLIAIGQKNKCFKDGYNGTNLMTYDTKEAFLEEISKVIQKGDVILVKASRGMKFEEIVKKLESISK